MWERQVPLEHRKHLTLFCDVVHTFPNQSPVDGHRSFRGAKILPAFSQLLDYTLQWQHARPVSHRTACGSALPLRSQAGGPSRQALRALPTPPAKRWARSLASAATYPVTSGAFGVPSWPPARRSRPAKLATGWRGPRPYLGLWPSLSLVLAPIAKQRGVRHNKEEKQPTRQP